MQVLPNVHSWSSSSLLARTANSSKTVTNMAAVVEKSMQALQLDKVDAVESRVTELHVYGTTAADNAEAVKAVAQPGTPAGKQAAAALADTGEKAKKARRRRGKKTQAPGKENVAPAGPVDVAAVLKARAAAKKKGSKPVSAAAQAALANAKARPAQKKKVTKGRVAADPGCNGY